ncbi:hypothetical protein N7530_009730 [Penicillium desertorum]|uniref:Uncharacterized protein n=1 Tax=Penicillium desertorum TaxID=1303715 RepID=A0A9X0BIG1_9EURO|nr:hypothetical protein N7530_009730 [Penicillium desertorum]
MATSRLAFTMPKGKCISCERSSTVRGLTGNRYHEMRRIIEQSVQWGHHSNCQLRHNKGCGLEYYADYCSVRGKKAWSAVICTVNWM